MSEDNKDKGSNQDKINALEAELKELKALEKAKAEEELKALEKAKAEEERISQEKIKKLNAEIDSIKKNSPTEEKEEVENFIPSREEKVVVQTFSNSGEIKKKGYIGLIISIVSVLLYNALYFITAAIVAYSLEARAKSVAYAIGWGLRATIWPFVSMLIVSIVFRNNNFWRTLSLLFLASFFTVILLSTFLFV